MTDNGGRHISSTWAFIIYIVSMMSGFVFATFFPAAPYGVLAPSLTAGAGAYWGKRLLQKSDKYGRNTNSVVKKSFTPDPNQPIGD